MSRGINGGEYWIVSQLSHLLYSAVETLFKTTCDKDVSKNNEKQVNDNDYFEAAYCYL